MTESQSRFVQGFVVLLGVIAFATVLAFHNITEGDLWAKLAIGSVVWNTGHLPHHDLYAFTPTLPAYIDHEWGAGLVFYGLLKWFGPCSLVIVRIVLALGLLGLGFWTARRAGGEVNVLLLLAVPAAAGILTGYIPVARSHIFTFFLFAATIFCLEELRRGAAANLQMDVKQNPPLPAGEGRGEGEPANMFPHISSRWPNNSVSQPLPAVLLPVIIILWTNLHGGFVVGLAVIFIYAANAVISRQRVVLMLSISTACAAVTLVNPYGLDFWRYLIPALLHPRLRILEWRPLPPLGWDDFWGFRLLFVLTVAIVAAGWKKVEQKNWTGLAVLAMTALMGWRSRRHGPFLGAAALSYAWPYGQAVLSRRVNLKLAVCVVYLAATFWVTIKFLPGASLHPLSPIGEDPVREVDILAQAGAKGNAATPFAWGSYVSWRLYPDIKISMDGRYETTYPESTFNLNNDFYDHHGDWLRLCREFKADYVILDLQTESLRPEPLEAAGYVLVTNVANVSALLCLPEHTAEMQKALRSLPPYTVDPLDLSARGNR